LAAPRSVLRRLDYRLEDAGLAVACDEWRRARADIALQRANAESGNPAVAETRHAAILSRLAGRRSQLRIGLRFGGAFDFAQACVPVLYRQCKIGAPDNPGSAAVVNRNHAEVVDDPRAVPIVPDAHRAAANSDHGRGSGDRGFALMTEEAADVAKGALRERYRRVAGAGTGTEDELVDQQTGIGRNAQCRFVQEQQLDRSHWTGLNALLVNDARPDGQRHQGAAGRSGL
jgi:hypothetical protein